MFGDNKIVRYINQNRKKIITIIIVIIFILLIFKELRNNPPKREPLEVASNKNVYRPEETIISGEDISTEKQEEDNSIVNEFIRFCNEGKSEEAYNLLTDSCKEVLYPTLEEFHEKYCKKYFNEKREYSLQSWVTDSKTITYRVRIFDDIMSTGNYKDSEQYQDYITTLKDNKEKKISINGYIERRELNKSAEKEGIMIETKNVDTFVDHQEYFLMVSNNTDKIVKLDNMQRSKASIRIETGDGKDFPVKGNSISDLELTIEPGQSKLVKISFNKKSTTGVAKRIVFKRVIPDYEKYEEYKEYEGLYSENEDENAEDSRVYEDYIEIEVEL